VDLCDSVLERSALDLILDLAITQDAFKGDELPLLEGLGEPIERFLQAVVSHAIGVTLLRLFGVSGVI
jgi:hypothetical protein